MAAQTHRRRRGRFLAELLAVTVVAGTFHYSALAADDGRIGSSVTQEGKRPEVGTPTPTACHQLVRDAGRMIAWARWEKGFSLEKTRSVPFPANTPAWMVALVQDWITDAYQWRPTEDQIFQWASELGNVANLPRADRLSRHETIAIWLRRIARMCTARSG